jgi:transcriptional regulator with XRE-family HTH domain
MSHLRVQELRNSRGLTQMELAVLSGVSRATIARYEAGEQRRPHPATVGRLARVLKVRPEDLRA